MLHLAGRDELRHRAYRLLDRRLRIDAMLVVEIDVVGAEPLQRSLDRFADVLGPAVGAAVAERADEFRREDVLIALPLDRAADELLVLADGVHLRRIEEVDAEV